MTSSKITKHINTIVGKTTLINHGLNETALFTDENLASAIENHPCHLLDICLKGSFVQVDRNGVSGKDVLQCVKKGLLWINLRRIESYDNPIGNKVKQMHKECDRLLGRKTYNQVGGLLISSPRSGAGYHFDLTDVTLWHIRGQKDIYIYPEEEPFLSQDGLEKVVLGRGVEDIPYTGFFDKHAQKFRLIPGEMIAWPHLAPHRVENTNSFNVSMSLEAVTMASRVRLGSHFFDAFTRKHFGFQFFGHSQRKSVQIIKTVLSILIKKIGASERDKEFTGYSFKLDMKAPNFLTQITDHELKMVS